MRYFDYLNKHKIPILTGYAVFIVFGTAAAVRIPFELLPALSLPSVTVTTEFESLPGEDVETLITAPLERGYLGMETCRTVASESRDGVSSIVLDFYLGTPLSLCFAETSEITDEIFASLPEGTGRPVIKNTSRTEEGPCIRAAVHPAGTAAFEAAASAAEEAVKMQLLHLEEVSRVELYGTMTPRITVDLDARRSAVSGLSAGGIREAVKEAVTDYYLGAVEFRGRTRSLRLTGGIDSAEALAALPLGTIPPLRLGDISTVETGYHPGSTYAFRNGDPYIGLEIYRNPVFTVLTAAGAVVERLETMEKEIPSLEFEIIEDSRTPLRKGLRELFSAVVLSIAAVAGVLSFFYRGLKAGILIAASMPASLLPTILVLYLLGKELNTVSLFGIIMGTGLIVDSSILVFHGFTGRGGGSGHYTPARLLPSIAASTVTTALVFIPVMFLPGITSALFRDLALTVSLLLLFSLASSAVLVPLLTALVPSAVRRREVTRRAAAAGRFYRIWFRIAAKRYLFPGLPLIVLSAAAFFIFLPKEALPRDRGNQVLVTGEFHPARSPGMNRESAALLCRELAALPDRPEVTAEGNEEAAVWRIRYPRRNSGTPEEREQREDLKQVLDGGGLLRYSVSPPKSPLSPFFQNSGELRYTCTALDRESLETEMNTLCHDLKEAGLCRTAEVPPVPAALQSSVTINPVLTRLSGTDPALIAEAVEFSRGGLQSGSIRTGRGNREIVLGNGDGRRSEPGVPAVPVHTGEVPVSAFGTIGSEVRENILRRLRGRPAADLFIDPCASRRSIERYLADRFGAASVVPGDAEIREAVSDVMKALSVSVLLIFFYLVIHYGSFRIPALLCALLPLPAAGSLLALALFSRSINIGSVLGILITLGTSLNTMIIIAGGGMKQDTETPLESAAGRLYPLAATTVTTVCAAVPGILLGEYGFQKDTALAVVGGIFFGSIHILMIFPTVLSRVRPKQT